MAAYTLRSAVFGNRGYSLQLIDLLYRVAMSSWYRLFQNNTRKFSKSRFKLVYRQGISKKEKGKDIFWDKFIKFTKNFLTGENSSQKPRWIMKL